MKWLALLVAVTGCNRLFGISEIPYAGDASVVAPDVIPTDAAPAPMLTIGVPSVDFGKIVMGNMSSTALVAITNVGTLATGTITLSIDGDSTSFAIDPSTCANAVLIVGGACSINVTFKPAVTGAISAHVAIGDGNVSTNLGLAGDGLGQGDLTMPANLTFDPQAVGSTSGSQMVTLTNTGGSALMLTMITLTGDTQAYQPQPTPGCMTGSTLGPNGTCVINVTFTPQLGGDHPASLVVQTNASLNPESSTALGGKGAVMVAVDKGGNGTGTVMSSDGQIVCGNTCGATFLTPTVTLTGTADPQSSLSSWSSGCVAMGGSCTVTANQSAFDITASFTAFVHLMVTISGIGHVTGSGIDCTGSEPTCTNGYPPGTQIQINPTTSDPYLFNLWGGACMNQNINDATAPPSCVLTMDTDEQANADFTDDYTLDVIPAPNSVLDPSAAVFVGGTTCPIATGCTIHYGSTQPIGVLLEAQGTQCTTFTMFYGNDCGDDGAGGPCAVDFSQSQVVVVDYLFSPGGGGSDCPQ